MQPSRPALLIGQLAALVGLDRMFWRQGERLLSPAAYPGRKTALESATIPVASEDDFRLVQVCVQGWVKFLFENGCDKFVIG
jgi:hypothetical protein